MDELIGQVRSMMMSSLKDDCCDCNDDSCVADYSKRNDAICREYSFTTLDFYCRSFGTYDAINNAKQQAVFENQKQQMQINTPQGSQEYNEEVLGLKYNDDGSIQNPFNKNQSSKKSKDDVPDSSAIVTCDGGVAPDMNGCCPGETYTDMGDQGFNCCPDAGGDCFPPIEL